MRIALLIYGRLSTTSGGFLYDRQLVRRLRAGGATVTVISFPWRSYGAHLAQNLSYRQFFELVNGRFDLILQDELNHPSLFLFNKQLKQKVAAPIISIVHHLRISEQWPSWQRPFYRWVESRYLNGVDGFIYNSQTTKQAVEKLLTRSMPHVVAPPAGDRFGQQVDVALVQQRAGEAGALRLLFVGNIQRRKGLHTLLAAVAQLPQGMVELTVVGSRDVEPAYAQEVEQQARAISQTNRVTFVGKVDDETLAGLLRQNHLLCVPSSYEGFGIVYLEGMGFGLPAIGTAAGGAGEIIENGRSGYLIQPDDVDLLARHLGRLASNRALLAEMSVAAIGRFRQQPTWDESMGMAAQFLAQLKER